MHADFDCDVKITGKSWNHLKRNNVQKCIRWCERHNIERIETLTPVNLLLLRNIIFKIKLFYVII